MSAHTLRMCERSSLPFLKLGVPTHHIRACRFDARTHIVHIGQGVFDLGPGGIQIGLSLSHDGSNDFGQVVGAANTALLRTLAKDIEAALG